jgi:hypothetical protein
LPRVADELVARWSNLMGFILSRLDAPQNDAATTPTSDSEILINGNSCCQAVFDWTAEFIASDTDP